MPPLYEAHALLLYSSVALAFYWLRAEERNQAALKTEGREMTITNSSLNCYPATAAVVSVDSLHARRGKTRPIMRIAWGAFAVLAVFGIVAATGAVYEEIANAKKLSAHEMTGRLVDVGGYRLHLDCRGQGTPAVILDAGLGGSSLDWSLVQPELASTTQVCSYDRAGMGFSDLGPQPRSPRHIAEELHRLLKNGGVDGPYVFVAHSLAGKTVRMFAAAHPEDVAGLVMVDARSEILDTETDTVTFREALRSEGTTYSIARRFGIARLFGAGLIDYPMVEPSLATQIVLAKTNAGAIQTMIDEGMARSDNDATLASATLGQTPLIAIAAEDSMRNIPSWREAQLAITKLSTHSRLIVAEQSDHYIQLAQPGIVLEAVKGVLGEARTRQ